MTTAGRPPLVVTLGLLCGACVTTYEDVPPQDPSTFVIPDYATAQEIPFQRPDASPEERLLVEFYGGILQRMQEAVDERNAETLFGLLDAYEKPNLPDWLADRLRGYRAIGHGLRFAEHAGTTSRLRVLERPGGEELTAPPPIGAPVHFEFLLPATTFAVRLAGRDEEAPVGFTLAIVIEDRYVDGGSCEHRRQDFRWLPASIDLADGNALRLPIELDLPADSAVKRDVSLRVDMIGYAEIHGGRVPLPRRTVAAISITQWPAGYEPIALRPLDTLREAIRLGDEAHFVHVFLGAWFTAGADREAAIGLLVDQVRLGSAAPATVAMATLRAITATDIPVGDREGWLAWYGLRR